MPPPLKPLNPEEYCHRCGQKFCTHEAMCRHRMFRGGEVRACHARRAHFINKHRAIVYTSGFCTEHTGDA